VGFDQDTVALTLGRERLTSSPHSTLTYDFIHSNFRCGS
jgi:hypothetical protein